MTTVSAALDGLSPSASSADYAYDVFISYRRVELMKAWIRIYFFETLRQHLEMELARTPRIFWDEDGIEEGDYWETRVKSALSGSICMIALLSKPYFSSPWCVAEFETFQRRAKYTSLRVAGTGLTIPIQWHDGQVYPPPVKALKPYDFREYATIAPYFRNTDGFISYEKKMLDLAVKLGKIIENPPPYQPDWPLIEPSSINITRPVDSAWTYTLKPARRKQ